MMNSPENSGLTYPQILLRDLLHLISLKTSKKVNREIKAKARGLAHLGIRGLLSESTEAGLKETRK